MGFHLSAFYLSSASISALTKVPAVQSVFDNVQNNNVVVGAFNNIIAAHGFALDMTRAQLQSPTLEIPGYPDIRPFNIAVPTNAVSPAVQRWFDSPLVLKPTEQLSYYATDNIGTGSDNIYGAVIFADKPPAPTKGAYRTLKLTGTTTLTAFSWTQVQLTFEDNLPVGKYTVIGARAKSSGCVYFRLGYPGLAYRPGGIGVQSDSAQEPSWQRAGGMGEWFTFDNTVILSADFLAGSGDTSEEVELDVIGPA